MSAHRGHGRQEWSPYRPRSARDHSQAFWLLGPRGTSPFWQELSAQQSHLGAYVDDLLIAGKVSRARARCLPNHDASCPLCLQDAGVVPDAQRFRGALASYEAAGAETSTEKVIDFSETFTAWGTEVKGSEGRVAVSDGKRRQVFRLMFGVLLSGHVSKHSLQSLLGSIIYPSMHRRELMCCLTEIFVFVESMSESKFTRVGDKVKDGLGMSALFMVMAFTYIRAPASTCVRATDATVRRAGACQTWVLQKVANACLEKVKPGESTRDRDGQILRLSIAPPRCRSPAQM